MKTLTSLIGMMFGGYLTLMLTGCSQPGYPTALPSSALTPLPALIVTNFPIPNETETTTPIPISTPIPSLLQSVTPLPTLSSDERNDRILALLTDNGGCRLPCWWRITPKKSTWLEVWKELSQFKPDPYIKEDPDSQLVDFLIPVSEEISLAYGINITLDIVEGVVQVISVRSIESAANFNIQRILVDYGKPSEVWIHTYRSYLGGIPPVDVLLFYPEQGVLARYATNLIRIDEYQDTANICLDSTPSLTLWSPDEQLNFDQAQDIARLEYKKYDKPLLPLAKAAGISIQQFYNYRIKERICLSTKLSLWPDP